VPGKEPRGAATAGVEAKGTLDDERGTRQREHKNKGHEGQEERESLLSGRTVVAAASHGVYRSRGDLAA